MSKYKVFKVEYTVKTTYTVDIDLASSKAEAVEIIREAVKRGNINPEEITLEGWELGSVKVRD